MTIATTKTERMCVMCVWSICLMARDSYRLHDAHSLSMVRLFDIMSPIAISLLGPLIRRYIP